MFHNNPILKKQNDDVYRRNADWRDKLFFLCRKLYLLLFPLPTNCPVCMQPAPKSMRRNGRGKTVEESGPMVCNQCRKKMLEKKKLYGQCKRCGSFGVDGFHCRTCAEWNGSLEKNIAIWPYEGDWKQLILEYKFRGMPWLADSLAREITPFIEEEFDWIVPVPLHTNRRRERGYNQSEELAKALARRSGIPWISSLERIRDTPHQTGENRRFRRQNLVGAFRVVHGAEPVDKRILLVDDVFTTGATMDFCGEVLKEAGAKSVTGITLAAGITREEDVL